MEGIRQISPHLYNLGVQTTVATLDSPNSSIISSGPSYDILPLGPGYSPYQFNIKFVSRLHLLAQSHDCIIIHGLWQFHSFATWLALRSLHIPYFIFPHGMLDPWFKTTYPLKHVKKSMYWPWSDYFVLRDATAVLFTSAQERLQARESFRPYHVHECL